MTIIENAWLLLCESAPYVVFGLLVSGVLSTVLTSDVIARHLGQGRVVPVVKAALFGIPLPLCSCGVLPAAVTLKKQGANRGALSAFMIATPESGVDSIAISYALLDPFLTVMRPVAALLSAVAAGVVENLFIDTSVPAVATQACCCSASPSRRTLRQGLHYAFSTVWQDMALWFFSGLFLAGMITALVPPSVMERWLGGGFSSLLVMLVVGVPIYICASASTPIAAALIMQGVSPGAALVFLLAGPATNVTSLTVLVSILGKRGTVVYLLVVSGGAVLCGWLVDEVYILMSWVPQAQLGVGSEWMPVEVEKICVAVLLVLSLPVVAQWLQRLKALNR
nr:permease [uncultured Desulfuromonas sp.]